MAKDKSKDTSKIKGGVLLLTDEELETAETRKDWSGGGGTLPPLGLHTAKITEFYNDGQSDGKATKGSDQLRMQVTLDDTGHRLTDWAIGHPTTASRVIKWLEVTDLKRVVKRPEGNELQWPTDDDCEAKVGLAVEVEVVSYKDDYKQSQEVKAGIRDAADVRQRPVWRLVRALGSSNGKASKSVNGKAEKQRIAR